MSCVVHHLDAREGGTFRVSLSYEMPTAAGKSSPRTDTYGGHFAQLVPDRKVVEVIEFETADSEFQGEMTITTTLTDADGGTDVVIVHEGIPSGVSAQDNDIGTRMALDNLAALVEEDPSTPN
jgi:uncharacterized protein YndB with AHSA1/START domain